MNKKILSIVLYLILVLSLWFIITMIFFEFHLFMVGSSDDYVGIVSLCLTTIICYIWWFFFFKKK